MIRYGKLGSGRVQGIYRASISWSKTVCDFRHLSMHTRRFSKAHGSAMHTRPCCISSLPSALAAVRLYSRTLKISNRRSFNDAKLAIEIFSRTLSSNLRPAKKHQSLVMPVAPASCTDAQPISTPAADMIRQFRPLSELQM